MRILTTLLVAVSLFATGCTSIDRIRSDTDVRPNPEGGYHISTETTQEHTGWPTGVSGGFMYGGNMPCYNPQMGGAIMQGYRC